jgi:hypothetical protein
MYLKLFFHDSGPKGEVKRTKPYAKQVRLKGWWAKTFPCLAAGFAQLLLAIPCIS